MFIHLDVSGGPEAGKRATFPGPVITIGRGPRNDLVLQDGLVSQYHGEVIRQAQGYLYRDLRSRHGTVVRLHHVTVNLHDRERSQEIVLVDGAQLILGESVIRVQLSDGAMALESPRHYVAPPPDGGRDERIVTRTHDAIETVTRRLSADDPRLLSLFRLSRSLNAASDPKEILELIVETTFEAFPAANFFAITPLAEGEARGSLAAGSPLISRQRRARAPGAAESGELPLPILSQSLLAEVAQSRESVLFVRDREGRDPSDSMVMARIDACMAVPLVGEHSLIGVMQADTRGLGGVFGSEDLDLFTVMAGYAAFAIERTRLNDAIVRMFEGFVRASVTAVEARDPSTAGHSERVAEFSDLLADAVDVTDSGPYADRRFTPDERTELRYAALLHDFGKIGVPEAVLVKAERLYPGDRRTVMERLETYRHALALEVYQRELGRLIEQGAPPGADLTARLAAELERIREDVDQIRRDILDHVGLEDLPDAVRRRFEAMAERRFTDLAGQERSLLTADERGHLTTPHGTLTASEWAQMKAHAATSRHYLDQIPWSQALHNVPCIAGLHHERLDGSGYPTGLRGEELPLQVRILVVCDVFDALTAADRPYRRAVSIEKAMRILDEEARRGLLDPDLVELFKTRVLPRVGGRGRP